MHEERRPRLHETIPNRYEHMTRGYPPPGYHEGRTTFFDLQEAGFYGEAKLSRAERRAERRRRAWATTDRPSSP
jgi:hypothetical protein